VCVGGRWGGGGGKSQVVSMQLRNFCPDRFEVQILDIPTQEYIKCNPTPTLSDVNLVGINSAKLGVKVVANFCRKCMHGQNGKLK
jgi:hypothetical protein